jgi:predicted GNAT family N-acyltransferase
MTGTPTDQVDDYCVEGRRGLTDPELVACLALLKRGSAVSVATAARHLPIAVVQALAVHDRTIIGVGAIKRARPRYAAKISRSSDHQIDPTMPELGYVTVDQEHRGHHLSSRIVVALLNAESGPLFATTDKEEMKTVLAKNNFVRCGHEWDGDSGCLSLWIRQVR